MALADCIALVAGGDHDRHRVARLASDAAQARLYPLYALNLEIGRAAWASPEPLVAEMRLQWWRDALAALCGPQRDGDTAAPHQALAHPVLAACGYLAEDGEAAQVLDALCEARRWDIWREPFKDEAALWAHLGATGGAVMWLAAHALGAGPEAEETVRDYGTGAALASWLQACPELEARGRFPLPDGRPAAIAALARAGQARMARARAQRRKVPGAALPALLTAWQAPALLALAARRPGLVAGGGLALPEFRSRATLAWRALSGTW